MTRKQKAKEWQLAFELAAHIVFNYSYQIGVRPKKNRYALQMMLHEEALYQSNKIKTESKLPNYYFK
jgi:hypothetical protein